MMLSEDLLADDSPLTAAPVPPPAAAAEGSRLTSWDVAPDEPLPVVGGALPNDAAEQEVGVPQVTVAFDKQGPLGIEFERLAAPYVVEQLHRGGLAFDSGLEVGHRLVTINGEAVESMLWDDLKERLLTRPVVAVFQMDPADRRSQTGGAALFSGFAGAFRSIGGSVAQQGLGLSTKVGSAGLDIGSKLGASGMDFGSKLGASGLDLSSKIGAGGLGGLGSAGLGGLASFGGLGALGSNLLGTAQSTPAVAAPVAVDRTEPEPPSSGCSGLHEAATAAEAAADWGSEEGAELPPELAPAVPAATAVAAADGWGSDEGEELPPDPAPAVPLPVAAEWALGQAAAAAAATDTQQVEADAFADGWGIEGTETPPASAPALPVVETVLVREASPAATLAVDHGIGMLAGTEDGVADWGIENSLPRKPLPPAAETPPAAANSDDGWVDLVGAAGGAVETNDVLAMPGQPNNAGHEVLDSSLVAAVSHYGALPVVGGVVSASDEVPQVGHVANGGSALPPHAEGEASSFLEEVNAPSGFFRPLRRLDATGEAQTPTEFAAEDAQGRPSTASSLEKVPCPPVVEAASVEAQAADAERCAERVRELEVAWRAAEVARQAAEQQLASLSGLLDAECREKAAAVAELEAVRATGGQAAAAARAASEAEHAAERRHAVQVEDLQKSLAATEAAAETMRRKLEVDATAQLAALEQKIRSELTGNFNERICALMERGEADVKREQDSWSHKCQEEATRSRKEVEQLKFALGQKDKEMAEKEQAVKVQSAEISSLLKQLAAVPVGAAEVKREAAEELPEKAAPAVTTFEVMFAMEGSLGLEFKQQAAPYIVAVVHPDRVATGLGINPGDELVEVAEESVTEASWPMLVQKLSKRPVVARFRRAERRQGPTGQDGSLLSSVSSAGSSLLTAAARRAGGLAGAGAEAGAAAAAELSRLQGEVERLGTLLRARDAAIGELTSSAARQQQALSVLESSSAGASETSQLVQEKAGLAQQAEQLRALLAQSQAALQTLEVQRDGLSKQCAEEARQKDVHRQEAAALSERCSSLMTQFDSLKNTCQSLSLDSKQKGELEGQVQELARMNAQWQQAHQHLTSESELLRQQASEVHQLQAEISRLRQFEYGWSSLESRVLEAERRFQEAAEMISRHDQDRMHDQLMIQRLQGEVQSGQENGEFEAGHLESELLERNRECALLRRDVEELRRRVADLVRVQTECQDAAEAGRALRTESEELRHKLDASKQEQAKLSAVVERCLEKMEKDGRERPFLVDKRMVTQMVAAYLEQRDHPRQQQEILARMADLLGFTTAEREQVGLSQKRRNMLEQQEAAGMGDLTDRFVDFLFEESEGG